jgi:iron complex transport system substrate-binding protein
MKTRNILSLLLLALLLINVVIAPLVAQDTPDCADGRLITHEMGQTCVPVDAERVVVLGPAATEFAYLAGKTIIGAPQHVLEELIYVAPHLAEEFEAITIVGWPPNPEVILSLAPDLIIGHAVEANTTLYDNLSTIAPTVIQPGETNFNWESAAEFWAEVLNSEDVFADLKANYDERIATLAAILAENDDQRAVSVLVASDPLFTFTRLPNSDLGKVFEDLGIRRPESQSEPNERGVLQISRETLNLADGDVMFLFGYPYMDEESVTAQEQYLSQLTKDRLWRTLSVVQNEQVFRVPDYWYRGGLYTLAVHQVLDDLFVHLAGVDPSEISPNPYAFVETPE